MVFPYFLVLVLMALAAVGLLQGGWFLLGAPLLAFGLVPLFEAFMSPHHVNPSKEDEKERLNNPGFDGVLALAVLFYAALWALFVTQVRTGGLEGVSYWGGALVMGLMCGGVGINIGHELGHRRSRSANRVAKLLLGSTLYMHFFIEHNRGHHVRVATEGDPASSRRGEWVYSFWFRSVIGGFRSAWDLEVNRCQRMNQRVWSLSNEMVRFVLAQAAWLGFMAFLGGVALLFAAVVASIAGILLLETVNYLEHYGLQRKKTERGYERVQPAHSWNSDHPLGRALLFELSRHSDHHANPRRAFAILRSIPNAPQLPTGYPGMILLSLIPPVFFAAMHPRLDALEA